VDTSRCYSVVGAGTSALDAKLCPIVDTTSSTERTARILTERVEALASALRAAGVDPAASARLLGSAAAAAMDALALDMILADAPSTGVPSASAPAATKRPDEQPIQLAA
jgi:hypothetical protein